MAPTSISPHCHLVNTPCSLTWAWLHQTSVPSVCLSQMGFWMFCCGRASATNSLGQWHHICSHQHDSNSTKTLPLLLDPESLAKTSPLPKKPPLQSNLVSSHWIRPCHLVSRILLTVTSDLLILKRIIPLHALYAHIPMYITMKFITSTGEQ